MSTAEEHDSIQIDFTAPRNNNTDDDSIEIGVISDKMLDEMESSDAPNKNHEVTLNGAALLSENSDEKKAEHDLFDSIDCLEFDDDIKDILNDKTSASMKKSEQMTDSSDKTDDEETGVFRSSEVENAASSEPKPVKRDRKASVKIVGSLSASGLERTQNETREKTSEVAEKAPEVAEKAPEVAEKAPEVSEKAPEVSEKAPEVAEKAPEVAEKAPEVAEKAPEVAEQSPMSVLSSAPDVRGLRGTTIKLAPDESELLKPLPRPSDVVYEVPLEERRTIARHPAAPSSPIEIDIDDLDVPDLSTAPVRHPSEFERTIVFEKSENRWDIADYKLPEIGEKVGDNYKIIDELGRGGFGAVYRAKNLTLGRDEALKLILPSAKSEVGDIDKRFEREIDIVSRLEHPNIVRLYSSGALEHGVLWMTMELVRGNRLDERIKQYGAMKFDKAKNLMLQLLSGLMEAHRRQIVHRDLKPANIILSKKEGYADQVVILDFGLSKALGASEDQTLQNVTVVDSRRVYGTPQYISPEQLTTGKLGPWTDVYAAGLIFYELLTGHPAVDGESLFDIAYKQSYEPITFPENLRDTVIEAIINKACAKNPAERYKHAGEFFDALQRVEDISDPMSVLRDESRGGHNLASIGMLEKTRDETAEMKTQIGLSAISHDEGLSDPVHHTEHTSSHGTSMALIMTLVVTITLSILFLLALGAYMFDIIVVTLAH